MTRSIENDLKIKGKRFVSLLENQGARINYPDLSSDPIYICIPIYKEFENAERLFSSYANQKIDENRASLNVLFFINNQEGDIEGYKENKATFDLMQSLKIRSNTQRINMHLIDAYSPSKSLSSGTTIGEIRNLIHLPIVKKFLANQRNGIVFSTDAEHFPTNNLFIELYKIHRDKIPCYGGVEIDYQFSNEFTDKEKDTIRKSYLLNDVSKIVLELLTYGGWTYPETMCGASMFYSTCNFLRAGGYTHETDLNEDGEMIHKLHQESEGSYNHISEATLNGLIRKSQRLELGDGTMITDIFQKRKSKTSLCIENCLTSVSLRKWLLSSFDSVPYLQGVNSEEFRTIVKSSGLSRKKLESLILDSSKSEDPYFDLYGNLINCLNSSKRISMDESIKGFEEFISSFMRKNVDFEVILDQVKNKKFSAPVLISFMEYARRIKASNCQIT